MHDYFLTKLLRIQGWYAKGKEIIEENRQLKVIFRHNNRLLDRITVLGVDEIAIGKRRTEATDLKARNIIRRAYGYRDKGYMELKVIQGCFSSGVFEPWSFFSNSS